MKQTILMIALTLVGTAGVFTVEPFLGVWVYYLFAVLRPQYMWVWSLPEGVNWSRYVALATLLALVGHRLGLFSFAKLKAEEIDRPKVFGPVHCWVAAFGVWVVLCYFLSPNHNPHPILGTNAVFVEYIKILIMFFAASVLVRRIQQAWLLFLLIGGTIAYIAYEVNYLYFVNHYLGIYNNGYAGLDNNGAGLMLAMGVPVCLFLWEGIGRWYRWAFLAVIPVIVHAVLMSYSRGAMLSLLVVCPIWLLRSRRRVQLGLLYCLVALAVPVMAGKEIRARFSTIEHHEVDESANSRRAAWAAATRMANENPVFGVGLRCANLFSHQYGADMEGRTIHSQYLQIAADCGWVGMALYVGIYLALWLNLRRTFRLLRGREDEEARRAHAIAAGVEGATAVFCFGSVFLSLEVFELPYLLVLLSAQLPFLRGVVSATAAPPELGEQQPAAVFPNDPFPALGKIGGISRLTPTAASREGP
jgi:probable O-glycosylation ligase (exosortase A-associated)